MKIAFLNIYNGVVERGSEIFVQEMAQVLSKNHAVSVFQSGDIMTASYHVRRIGGIPFVKNQNILYDFSVFLFTIKTIPYLWREKFDWIIPINGRWQVILCRLLRFLRGGKILISGHAGVGLEDKLNIIFGNPDIFVALSPEALKWAQKFTSHARYIPNGVNIHDFTRYETPINLSLKKPIIICTSALLPYKQVDLIIKAVAQMKNTSLCVIGDGPLKNKIEELGQRLLGIRFKLLTQIPHKSIASYYKAADVFTLVSQKAEAFGLVYLEAMACNIPVVAPDDINRHEIIGNAGIFCNPLDVSAYKKALQEALVQDWGEKPQKQAEKFSWDIISTQYETAMNQ